MQHAPRNQPLDFELDAGVHDAVEVARAVFEGERIRIREVGDDKKVEFGREPHHVGGGS